MLLVIYMSVIFSVSTDNFSAHHSFDEHPNVDDFQMHAHSNCELYYFISGKGTFYVEGHGYPLRKGDILLMNSTESHYIALDGDVPYERFTIHFNKELITSFDEERLLLSPFEKRPAGKLNRFRRKDFENNTHIMILENILKRSKNREFQIKSNLLTLLNELNIAYERKLKKELPDNETTIQQIINYVNDNLSEPITLDLLCRHFGISKPQLCRSFKNATGSTVWNYLTTKRLLASREMIMTGSPVTKICNDFGYTDYSAFYRAYQKFFGHSPKEDYKR